MSNDKTDYYFDDLLTATEKASSQVVPDGETWRIDSFVGSGAYDPNCFVSLIWDYEGGSEEIMFFTAGTLKANIKREIVGDGVKKLALVLTNNALTTCRLGGSYIATKL